MRPGIVRAVAILGLALALAACGSPRGGDRPSGAGGYYKVGQPYQVGGEWYYPQEDPLYDETGIASWYGAAFHGRKTANGEIFDRALISAAHKTLPMPVNVRITNLENGRALVVRVNDRGPFKPGRVIDVSEKAAELLDFKNRGVARVRVQYVGVAMLADGKPGKRVSGLGEHADLVTTPPPPTARVQGAELPPPPGAAAAPTPRPAPKPVIAAPAPTPEAEPPGTVTRVAVRSKGQMYVQAGAFLGRDNAERLLVRLKRIADFRISSKSREGKVYHLVRVGPLATVEEADAILERVLHDGQKGAAIVVE